MKKETKRQLIAIFILLMFAGSSIAFAFISVIPGQEQPEEVQLIFNRPLENAEEAPYLQQNYVIVKYFWSDDCADCDLAEAALMETKAELKDKIVIEKIKLEDWPEHAETLDIESAPTFYLKGRTIVTTRTTDQDDLIRAICPLYFYYIDECAFLT